MKRKILFTLVCMVTLSSFSTVALAAVKTDSNPSPVKTDSAPSDSVSNKLENPLNVSSLPELLTAILNGVVEIGAILLTVMIVYVGFLFVAAQGNEEKIRSARSALVWTVIGGLILLGASAISAVIQATVGSITS